MSEPNHDNLNSGSNPYSAPTTTKFDQAPKQTIGPRYSPYVWQVKLVSIFMIIQGVLELMYGIYMSTLSLWMPTFSQPPGGWEPGQEQMVSLIVYSMVGMGVVILLVAIARIIAGIMGLQYRGRMFGIVINAIGLLNIITCYCLPTALAICVYSMIIYFNRDVIEAFAMKAQGHSGAEIQSYFGAN